jgi:phage protein U
MPITRVPLGHNIGSRNGTLDKDSKLGNAIIEVEKSESLSIVKRPGMVQYQSVGAGAGLGIFAVGSHFFSIVGTTFYDNGVSKGTVDGTDEYDFIASIDQTLVFLKNEVKGYVYTIATGTLLDLSGTITTQSGTRTIGSPTVVLSATNGAIQPGQLISGTGIVAGTYVLTVFGTSLTLSQNASASGTSTLTFTTSYPGTTVSGAVFVDGYYVVGTPDGLLYNSNVEDPTTWQAINYIGVVSDADKLVAIGRTINYIVAMGSETTEFFYDAGTSPGSPFLPYQNSVLQFGAAGEDTLVQMDNTLVWVSTNRQKGFQVMALAGQTPQVISNQYIERIINNADPDLMYAFSIKTSGHSLYILTLRDTGYTLVYDMAQKGWTYWTTTEDNVEGYFKCIHYTKFENKNMLQHETNGKAYILSQNYYNDYGNPITVLCRTPLVDFGNNDRKFFSGAQVVGDKIDSYALLRYTNDDYQTYSGWVNINLNTQKSQANRLGQARRRSFDLLHADNVPLRLQYLEIDFEQGES